MPNAVTTQPKPEVNTDKPFVMPVPARGQQVLFYPNANVNAYGRTIATVLRITRTNCELTLGGRIYEGVRHVDDPALKTNEHARAFGCWEMTDRDKMLNSLEQRVSKLESLLK